jgi:hypothetical protein
MLQLGLREIISFHTLVRIATSKTPSSILPMPKKLSTTCTTHLEEEHLHPEITSSLTLARISTSKTPKVLSQVLRPD